jgi:aminoglycoside phosphotransferase family enzyme
VVPSSTDLFVAARAAARARVVAAGLSDEDIDALIEKARTEIAAEDK